MCAITHDGGWVKLSLPVPPRIALEKSSGNTTAGKDKVTLKFVQSAY